MEASIWSFFSRRKGSTSVSTCGDSFQPTNGYDSLPAGEAPRVGAYPVKPSDNKFRLFGQGKTRSIRTSLSSRTKSMTSSSSTNYDGSSSKSRNNSSNQRERISESSIPPVPQIPIIIPSGRLYELRSAKHLDLFTAVGSRYHSPSPSLTADPYSKYVAERNASINSSLEAQFRLSSASKYSEMSDHNIALPDGRGPPFEGTRVPGDTSMDNGLPASLGTRSRNVYSSAQYYARCLSVNEEKSVPPGMREPPPAPLGGSLQQPNPPAPLAVASCSPERTPGSQKEGNRQDRSSSSTTGQVDTQAVNGDSASTEKVDTPSSHRSSQHRIHSSLSSTASARLSSISEGRYRDVLNGEQTDPSDMDDIEEGFAKATPEKADPIRILQTSIVGADEYSPKPTQAVVARILDDHNSSSRKFGRKPHQTADRHRPPDSWQTPHTFQYPTGDHMATASQDLDFPPIASVPDSFFTGSSAWQDFDLQAEFDKLNRRRDEIECCSGMDEAERCYHYTSHQDPFYTGPSKLSQSAGQLPIVRDFAFFSRAPERHPSPCRDPAALDSDTEDTEDSEPPAITRHRDTRPASRATRTRNRSTSREKTRHQSSTHTLRATIADGREYSAHDQGHEVESIAQKRSRSQTLETMARAPLDFNSYAENSTASSMARLKELLAQLPPTRPTTRASSNRPDCAGPPSFPMYGGRFRAENQPAGQLQHAHDQSPESATVTVDEEHGLRKEISEDEFERLDPRHIANPAAISVRSPIKPHHHALSTIHDYSPVLSAGTDPDSYQSSSTITPTAFSTPPQIMALARPEHGVSPGYWSPGHGRTSSGYSDHSVLSLNSIGSANAIRHPVPPRLSSIKRHESQKGLGIQGGDYFGEQVISSRDA